MYVLSRTKGFRIVTGTYPPRTARRYQMTCYDGFSFAFARRLAAERILKDHPGKEVVAFSTSHDACVWVVEGEVFVLSWKALK